MYIANSTGGLMLQTMLYLANQSSRAVNTLYDFPPAPKSDLNEIKCYGVYGCFPLNGPWTTNTRQINVHPQKPSEIQPHFALYTSRNFDYPLFIDLNDPESVRSMGINPEGKIFFIAHGYLERGDMPWMIEMGKTLMSSEPEGGASVILIDWGGGSTPPYVQAVANIRLVGSMAAHVIHMLYEELEMSNLDNVHFIGHSLGAHMGGYAGYHLQRDFGLKLARITGMDPAAPLFTETEPIVRLDVTDAKYVDVIHTDANALTKGGLGIYKNIGHMDFYPNGGYDNPGCGQGLQSYINNKEKSFFVNMQEFVGCNHIRSYQYFTESVKSKCPFVGITCDSYESLKAGKCSKCGENGMHCLRMGLHSYEDYSKMIREQRIQENSTLSAYLMTGDKKPFCRVHYKITVKISNSDESTLHGGEIGTLSVRLHSHRKRYTDKIKFSAEPRYFEPGLEYTAMVPGRDLNHPTYAAVFWEYQTNLLNPLTWRILSSPRIYLDYIVIESMEKDLRLKLCPRRNAAVLSGSENIFDTNYCSE